MPVAEGLPAPRSGSELQRVIAAERAGAPLLLLRGGDDELQVLVLPRDGGHLTIGRGPGNAISLPWDSEVSRTHAELERVGEDWMVADDGLSSNGTFVNGQRLAGRRRVTSFESATRRSRCASLPPLG